MSDIILHHYPTSLYSEKVRAMLGYKQLPWGSVETPSIAPKSELTALSGGYRKAPVLQLGRDIYCDTRLMARLLDRLQPTPALVPPQLRASCQAFAALERNLFFATVPVVFQPAGLKMMLEKFGADFMQRFSQDREQLFRGGSERRPNAAYSKLNFLPLYNAIDSQLAGSAYLLGDAPTLADFICYHCAWFVLINPGVAASLDPFKNLLQWAQRMRALGHGSPKPMSAEEALSVARGSTQQEPYDGPVQEPEGLKLGQSVSVCATDYGCDAVTGRLVHASVFELVLQRQDPHAGEVYVHFPRDGFSISAAQ